MPPKTVLLVRVIKYIDKKSKSQKEVSIKKLYVCLKIVYVYLCSHIFFWHEVEYLSSSTKEAVDTDPRRAVSLLLRQAGGQGL